MHRSSIRTSSAVITACVLLLTGCMALPKGDRTMFQEPPLASKGTLPLKAGLMTLTDARPAGQRGTLDIEDFPDRITLELLMDLSEARLFSSIAHDLRGAEVVLRGEIRAFAWTPKYDWPPYVPGFGILAAFGGPVAHSTSEVALAIDVVDPRTDRAIASYVKSAAGRRSYWVYRYQDFTAGSDRDTDSPFRQVAEELQAAILADGERIVAAVKR